MRVAVYARVSTEHEAQINALENQLEWYKIECSRHSDWEIVEVYVDQGITGTQAQKRPEFLRMMENKRQELSDQIEQMEQEKTAIEQQVKLQMQDAAYGTAPGYKVSWVSSESKRVDSQRLKKEQPDIFNRYSKNVSSRRFTIVHAA